MSQSVSPSKFSIVNPLLTLDVRPIRCWHEWLGLWDAAATSDQLLGLLHRGFKTQLDGQYPDKSYTAFDRLRFYFSVADGWCDKELLKVDGEDGRGLYDVQDKDGRLVILTKAELRTTIARKAFEMLGVVFFDLKLYGGGVASCGDEIMEIATTTDIMPLLQNFFRVEQSGSDGIVRVRNLPLRGRDDKVSNLECQVREFFLALAEAVWRWKKTFTGYDTHPTPENMEKKEAVRTRLNAAKLWLIEMLAHFFQLKVLEKWVLDLDELCLGKLREIALRNKIGHYHDGRSWPLTWPVGETRQVVSLDEACLIDSEAAWLVKRYELMVREYQRLSRIQKAERRKADAELELLRLQRDGNK